MSDVVHTDDCLELVLSNDWLRGNDIVGIIEEAIRRIKLESRGVEMPKYLTAWAHDIVDSVADFLQSDGLKDLKIYLECRHCGREVKL